MLWRLPKTSFVGRLGFSSSSSSESAASQSPGTLLSLGSSPSCELRDPEYAAFLERLKADGGDKLMAFRVNVLHIEPSRFYTLCNDIKGLRLYDALLQTKWHSGTPGSTLLNALKEGLVKARDVNGFDLSKTFIADAVYLENQAILSERHKKLYLRGRGRYGAIPHVKSGLLSLLFQERDKGFEAREKDELEQYRATLRAKQVPWVGGSLEEIYAQKKNEKPFKVIYS